MTGETDAGTTEERPAEASAGQGASPLGSRLGHTPVLHAVLARKILQAHLRNRSWLLDPLPPDMRTVPPEEAALLIRAMAAAAHADGVLDPMERKRIRTMLAASGIGSEERQRLERTIEEPPCLEPLARSLSDTRAASRVYAVSLIVLDRTSAVNQAYLRYLAQRLSLPNDLVVRLNRRYGLPV